MVAMGNMSRSKESQIAPIKQKTTDIIYTIYYPLSTIYYLLSTIYCLLSTAPPGSQSCDQSHHWRQFTAMQTRDTV